MSRARLARAGTWDWLFVVACGGVFLVLAFLGRSTTFWLDDWVMLASPDREGWTLDAFMRPHNDHWQLTQMLVWKALQSTVGLRSHLPYLLATLALHITAAVAAYVLVRRQAGPFIAFSAGLLFLLLGTAGEVFFFAAAFNLVAATAFGSWALLLALSVDPFRPLGRGRQVFVAMLLLAATASGGPGLFYLAAIFAMLLLVTGRRRELWVVLPAGVAFAAWKIAYGSGSGALDALSDVSALRTLGDYVRTGVAHASGAVTGLEDQVGLVIAVALLGATAWHLLGRGPLRLGTVAGAAGLVSAYLITGMARAHLGLEQATAARYVYTAAPFVLLLLSAWLGAVAPIEARRPRVALTVAVFMAVALAANVAQLRSWQRFFLDRATETRAAIALLTRYGGSPAIPDDQAPVASADLRIDGLPTPDRLRQLLERDGSPLDDPFSGTSAPSPAEEERVLLRLVEPALEVTSFPEWPAGRELLDVSEAADATLTLEGPCTRVVPSGAAPSVTLRAPNGGRLAIRTEAYGKLAVVLSRTGSWDLAIPRAIDVPSGGVTAVRIPDLGDAEDWLVRLSLPAEGASVICGTAP